MNAIELATELTRLEGIEQQFEILVTQLLAVQRQKAVAVLMKRPSATPANVAEQLTTLDQALEKLDHNLRCQYSLFLDAQVAFRAANMTIDELEQSVSALRDEGTQKYLAKTRSLREAAASNTLQIVERMMQAAMRSGGGDDDAPAARTPPLV